jgi:anaphase-promoting complex subunit 5
VILSSISVTANTEYNQVRPEVAQRLLPLIRQTCDRELLAPYLVDYCMLQWASSEYREAHQSVSEAIEILAQERTENLYLSLAYQKSQLYIPRSLLFLGEWGEALRQIDDAITTADRNGDQYPAQLLRLHRAWFQLHAMDFCRCLENLWANGRLDREFHWKLLASIQPRLRRLRRSRFGELRSRP